MTTSLQAAPPTLATPLIRTFRFQGKDLTDPNPNMTPEQVKSFYAATHPELLNAGIGSPKDDLIARQRVIDFVPQMGRKG